MQRGDLKLATPNAEAVSSERPLSQAWISEELLADTQRVWSEAYQRPITEPDAIEILTNVKRLAEVLHKQNLRRRHERDCLGTRLVA